MFNLWLYRDNPEPPEPYEREPEDEDTVFERWRDEKENPDGRPEFVGA